MRGWCGNKETDRPTSDGFVTEIPYNVDQRLFYITWVMVSVHVQCTRIGNKLLTTGILNNFFKKYVFKTSFFIEIF